MTVCFTGHRALPAIDSPAYQALTSALDAAIEAAVSDGDTAFIAGGAAGFDTLCAERVLLQKNKNAAVTLAVYLPYRRFGDGFPLSDRTRAKAVLSGCDRTVVLSERQTPACFALRNQTMVRESDRVIAFLREPRSGTGQTVRMAQEKGIPVLFL